MTLLELVQAVADELGINRPTNVVGTTDPQIRQLYALLNRLGTDLVTQFEWQGLDKEFIINTVSHTRTGTTTAGSSIITGLDTTSLTTQFGVMGSGVRPFAQITALTGATATMNMTATKSGTVSLAFPQVQYSLPSDWQKEIPQTEWDRSNRWPLIGPQSAQDWQSFKSGIVYAGPRQRFRIVGNTYAINPPPPNGLVFALEYISKAWAYAASGTAQIKFLADTDTCIFNDSIMITGLKSQWKAAKGLDDGRDRGEFVALLEMAKAQNKSAPVLNMSPTYGTVLLTNQNIPDSGYGG